MPYGRYRNKKKYRRRKKNSSMSRRTYRPRYRPIPLSGFPYSKIVKLKFVEQVQIDPTVGSLAAHVFSANGMVDPSRTAGGSARSPNGFDQWMGIYNHFTVVGSTCNVKYMPDATTNVTPGYVTVILSANGTSAASYGPDTLLESKLTSGSKVVGLLTGNSWPLDRGVTKRFSAKRFFHKTGIVNSSLYRGTAADDPTEEAFYEVVVGSLNGNDVGQINLMVTLYYIAVLTEPIALGPS